MIRANKQCRKFAAGVFMCLCLCACVRERRREKEVKSKSVRPRSRESCEKKAAKRVRGRLRGDNIERKREA